MGYNPTDFVYKVKNSEQQNKQFPWRKKDSSGTLEEFYVLDHSIGRDHYGRWASRAMIPAQQQLIASIGKHMMASEHSGIRL